MMPVLYPQHWRERVEQARAVAAWLTDREAKRLLEEVAERYEAIAKLAEEGRLEFAKRRRLVEGSEAGHRGDQD